MYNHVNLRFDIGLVALVILVTMPGLSRRICGPPESSAGILILSTNPDTTPPEAFSKQTAGKIEADGHGRQIWIQTSREH